MTWAGTLRSFFIGVVIFATPTAMAQEIPPESTHLTLEVHFYPAEPPAYQTVPGVLPRGAWYARFRRPRGWVQPPDSPAVTAVNIKSVLAEDGVRVWVSVFLGELHEQERNVASYILHEGEKITVGELAQVGVEPFEFAVRRLVPSIGQLPEFTSKAKSIELVVRQPNFSTLPSYEVVVRNLSAKNVTALRVRILQDGRARIISMPQGKEGQPLILPGATYEFSSRLATRATPIPGGYTPVILPDQVIEVSTAVFDDASFEGDREAAIAFTAFQMGRKKQLASVMDLFQRSLVLSSSTPSTTLGWLKAEVGMLNLEADLATVQDVHGKFPNMPNSEEQHLKTTIEVGMKGLRDDVLKEIVQFQLRNRRSDANTFREWLRSSTERYEAWLGRL